MKKEKIVFSKPQLVDDVTILDARIKTFKYNLHAHNDYAIGMTLKGQQCFWCNGKDYISRPGDIIQFNPEDPHNGYAGDNRELTYKMMYISRNIVDDMLIDTKSDLCFKETVTNDPRVKEAFIELAMELGENSIITDHSDIMIEFIEKLIECNDFTETNLNGLNTEGFVATAINYISKYRWQVRNRRYQ